MILVQLLRSIIFFTVVVSLAAVSVDEEKLESDEEFDAMNNDEDGEEEENPSFDNAADIQEGYRFHDFLMYTTLSYTKLGKTTKKRS